MMGIELINTLEQGLIYSIVSIGVYFTFRIIDFPDLTCDASFSAGAAVSAMSLTLGFHPFIAFMFACFIGAISGLCTAMIHLKAHVSPLLSGILTAFMFYSITLHITNESPNIPLGMYPNLFDGGSWWSSILTLGLISLSIWAFCSYLLSTDFGLGLRAVGYNPSFCRLFGIAPTPNIITALMLGNACIAGAGSLYSQLQWVADISQGNGALLLGFAGVLIGERILPSKKVWLSLLACIVGSIVYKCLISVSLHLEFLKLRPYDLNLVTGILVIIIFLSSKKSSIHL